MQLLEIDYEERVNLSVIQAGRNISFDHASGN